MPKNKIYERATVTPRLRQLFVEQVDAIIWQYKLAPETINLRPTASVPEIQIFRIRLRGSELSADILERGIVLTGGGALLRGLEELIAEKTGINTMTAEDPMKVVAIGTGQFVEFMSGRKEH